ncbi:MAG TPA: hypothetical protein VGF94_26910 [Kofleriaceae bacterium]
MVALAAGWRAWSAAALLLVPLVALAAALVALAGGIVRARWGALASLGSALALAASLVEIVQLRFRMKGAETWAIAIPALLGAGAITAAIGGLVAWRTARSTLRTLRDVPS